jgi:hypothetical protein
MKGNNMNMKSFCAAVRNLGKSAEEISKKHGVNIYLDNIYDENETPVAPNIVFGYSCTDKNAQSAFLAAFDELWAFLAPKGFVMFFECSGDGDEETLMSYRVTRHP